MKRNIVHLSRRSVLAGGAAGLLAGVLPKAVFAQETTKITTAFGWISNVEYGGFWTALEQGYFAEENIEADYITGGPQAPDTLVSLAADRSQVSGANWLPILDAAAKGNDFVILGAQWQKSPSALISLAAKPVQKPEDLVGMKILAQNASDRVIIDSVLGKAGLPLDYEIVPTGFSPEPLLAGDGDAYFAFATNQPITLEQMGLKQGEDFYVTLFEDLGYNVKQGLYVAKRSFLDEHRDAVVGYLRALVKGWRYAIDNPAYAPQIVVDTYGADLGLDPDQQKRQMELQIPLIEPEDGQSLLMFDPAIIEGDMTDAAKAADRTVPPLDKLVDLGPLKDALASL
ncbi:ABC transporter substrate-binding protein [Consotaella aegiceratis]|uniref:ABC transporter substrate-binding protein n=1 Tax=Consotaella aegiceratis TaxID=3097961 RepID=UPI002F3FCC1A